MWTVCECALPIGSKSVSADRFELNAGIGSNSMPPHRLLDGVGPRELLVGNLVGLVHVDAALHCRARGVAILGSSEAAPPRLPY